MKKSLFAAVFCCLTIAFGGCKDMDKRLEGKEGIFAIMETTQGTILLELFYKETPLTVTNFVGLAEGTLDAAKGKPFYDGLKFHRVISKANGDGQDFMIQGGDPQGTGAGGPGYRFIDEIVNGLTFDKPGYLAMANAGAGTNGSQFFITIAPTEWLNGKHTIFGKVVDAESQKIVDKTKQGDTIKKITIVRQGNEAKKFTASQKDWNEREATAKKTAEELKAKQLAAFTEGCIKSPNGIYYKILSEGKGNKAGKGKTASVEYQGYLQDGSIFDASKGFHPQGHEGLSFRIGAGEMIPGFDLMVQDMKVGEKRTIVIPPELAYGARGVPQAGIPGGAYIAFDIELTSIK
ncbi:MAG: peptidylprolyl isomerase [Treponema sp.]|nr:peptidylprolyl isomerase [Treponema sp.]